MARHEHKKRQRAGHRAFLAAGAARLTFDSELRACGFEAAEIEAAWSCRDDIERVAIELMILAAGLASIDDLASEVVRRARNTLGWAGVVQMPFEKFEPLARRAWDEWETLTGRPLQERPSSVRACRRGDRPPRRCGAETWLGRLSCRDGRQGRADHRSQGTPRCDRASLSRAQK